MRGDGGIGVEPGIAAHPDIALRGVAPRETWPLQGELYRKVPKVGIAPAPST